MNIVTLPNCYFDGGINLGNPNLGIPKQNTIIR
jgi:hypothetical protein